MKELEEIHELLICATKKIKKLESGPRTGGYFSGEYISINLSGMADQIERYNEIYEHITRMIFQREVLNSGSVK